MTLNCSELYKILMKTILDTSSQIYIANNYA